MGMMDGIFTHFDTIFAVVGIIVALIFIFVIISVISPKFRGMMMSREVKAQRHMVDYSQEDMEHIATKKAEINRQAVGIYTEAVVKGIDSARKDGGPEATMYCKHCGALIDGDSKFCKECGGEQ